MWVEIVLIHCADGRSRSRKRIVRRVDYSVRVVDTVGVGDAFAAGFLAGRLRS
jgi:sugar/nucleoside kinase (ribokinase family)